MNKIDHLYFVHNNTLRTSMCLFFHPESCHVFMSLAFATNKKNKNGKGDNFNKRVARTNLQIQLAHFLNNYSVTGYWPTVGSAANTYLVGLYDGMSFKEDIVKPLTQLFKSLDNSRRNVDKIREHMNVIGCETLTRINHKIGRVRRPLIKQQNEIIEKHLNTLFSNHIIPQEAQKYTTTPTIEYPPPTEIDLDDLE